jgi:hypothetical protein
MLTNAAAAARKQPQVLASQQMMTQSLSLIEPLPEVSTLHRNWLIVSCFGAECRVTPPKSPLVLYPTTQIQCCVVYISMARPLLLCFLPHTSLNSSTFPTLFSYRIPIKLSRWPSTSSLLQHHSQNKPLSQVQPQALYCPALYPPTNHWQHILRPTRPHGLRVTVALEYVSIDCAIVIIRTNDFTSPMDCPPVLLIGTAAATHIPRYKNRFHKAHR